MAYSAVVCVEQILKQLLQYSDEFPLYLPKSELESFYGKICSLQSSLEKIFPVRRNIRAEVTDLETQIRDAIYKAQDAIEAIISRSSDESSRQDLQKIISAIGPITDRAKKIADSIKSGDLLPVSALHSQLSPSSRSTTIVGQEKDLEQLTAGLLKQRPERQVIPITGLPGIGKTTLARSIFEERRIVDEFSIRSWVTVGQEYHAGEIFLKLLASMESKGQKNDVSDKVNQGSAEQLAVQLYKTLFKSRYLIVIDDVWDIGVWDKIRNYLPDNKNGSRIVLTTRIEKIARKVNSELGHEMKRLDEETSWRLLRGKVFGEGKCPPQLETVGKEIAKHCDGLPLSLTVVGGQLSQETKTMEYWKIVEEDTKTAAAKQGETYLEILSLSYNHLPSKLKGCFLYMGAFPEDSEIFASKLIRLWVAEGFLAETETSPRLEEVAEQCLNDLVDRNLIFVRKFSSNGKIRTCGVHDSIRYLAETKSQEEMFFHSIKRSANQSQNRELRDGENAKENQGVPKEGKDSQRRISVHKNILMCMKDDIESTKSIKLARTLLYAGPYHHHPLPFCLTFDLLRVLDAVTVYFIEFPDEVVKLVHLRYLSLTYNGKLPPSLSKLQKLLILIVRRYPKIIIMGKSILPVEIWNMPQLRHLVLTDSDLPRLPENHADESAFLKNLQSLSNINAACCTEEILRNMPNLKKLGIWTESPGPLHLYLDQLQYLESFKFSVLNPIPGDIQPKLNIFPETLKKLSLSGCGLPWDAMTTIGQLPCLEVLKLRQFAFQGREWYPENDQFDKLKFLLLESLNLVCWGADHSHFPSLERLIIRRCYELVDMDSDIGSIGTLKLIELVGCSSLALKWAQKIEEELEDYGNKQLQVRIYSSWE